METEYFWRIDRRELFNRIKIIPYSFTHYDIVLFVEFKTRLEHFLAEPMLNNIIKN